MNCISAYSTKIMGHHVQCETPFYLMQEDFRVPTPIYPTFKTGINLTKTDIITMYCRER